MHRENERRSTMGWLAVAVFTVAGFASAIAQTPPTAPAGGQGRGAGGRGGPATPPLIMTTTAWEDGGVIPDKYTQKGGQMGLDGFSGLDRKTRGKRIQIRIGMDAAPESKYNPLPQTSFAC